MFPGEERREDTRWKPASYLGVTIALASLLSDRGGVVPMVSVVDVFIALVLLAGSAA